MQNRVRATQYNSSIARSKIFKTTNFFFKTANFVERFFKNCQNNTSGNSLFLLNKLQPFTRNHWKNCEIRDSVFVKTCDEQLMQQDQLQIVAYSRKIQNLNWPVITFYCAFWTKHLPTWRKTPLKTSSMIPRFESPLFNIRSNPLILTHWIQKPIFFKQLF